MAGALRHLDQRRAETKTVANGDIVFIKAGGGNILPECAWLIETGVFADFLAPDGIMIARIMMQGLFRPAMQLAITLRIAFKPFYRHAHLARNGLFVDAAWHIAGGKGSNLASQ